MEPPTFYNFSIGIGFCHKLSLLCFYAPPPPRNDYLPMHAPGAYNTVCNLHINQGYNPYNPKAYDIPDTEDIGWKIYMTDLHHSTYTRAQIC